MIIKELIEILKKHDENKVVWVSYPDGSGDIMTTPRVGVSEPLTLDGSSGGEFEIFIRN